MRLMLDVGFRQVHPLVKLGRGKGSIITYVRYFEPFLGSTEASAAFLHLASKSMISAAYLSDTNEELINSNILIDGEY